MMMTCSPKAYAKCPTRALCGKREDATFTEGSECDLFNRAVWWVIRLSMPPKWSRVWRCRDIAAPSGKRIGTMPNFTAHWLVYDFELCPDVAALKQALAKINHYGFNLVSVTQDASGTYTVFFRRLAA